MSLYKSLREPGLRASWMDAELLFKELVQNDCSQCRMTVKLEIGKKQALNRAFNCWMWPSFLPINDPAYAYTGPEIDWVGQEPGQEPVKEPGQYKSQYRYESQASINECLKSVVKKDE